MTHERDHVRHACEHVRDPRAHRLSLQLQHFPAFFLKKKKQPKEHEKRKNIENFILDSSGKSLNPGALRSIKSKNDQSHFRALLTGKISSFT
jgi:hypothetical protein